MRNKTTQGIGALAIIGLTCAALLGTTDQLTAQRIADNAQLLETRQITELVGMPPQSEAQWIDGVWRMCNGASLVRAQSAGYGGRITALVARQGARLTGLRVTAHQETPGIADFAARPEDPWRRSLLGSSTETLADVDVVAGATITSRALVTLATQALQRPLPPRPCPP